jgi:hypothetical protein
VVTTADEELAARVRRLRDYGKEEDYDVRAIGLNARWPIGRQPTERASPSPTMLPAGS